MSKQGRTTINPCRMRSLAQTPYPDLEMVSSSTLVLACLARNAQSLARLGQRGNLLWCTGRQYGGMELGRRSYRFPHHQGPASDTLGRCSNVCSVNYIDVRGACP